MTLSFSPPLVVWHFDDFVLDLPRYELRRNGIAIRMEPQVFDVLALLIRERHRVLPKNELLDTVWGHRFVTESALTSRIKSVRHAVGDDGTTQHIVRTVRRRGYQFIAEVTERAARATALSRRPTRYRKWRSPRRRLSKVRASSPPAVWSGPAGPVMRRRDGDRRG